MDDGEAIDWDFDVPPPKPKMMIVCKKHNQTTLTARCKTCIKVLEHDFKNLLNRLEETTDALEDQQAMPDYSVSQPNRELIKRLRKEYEDYFS